MAPIALIAFLVALGFAIWKKEWWACAIAFVAGIVCAATPAGGWVTTNLNHLVDWLAALPLFHRG